jgi:hypothetical protein
MRLKSSEEMSKKYQKGLLLKIILSNSASTISLKQSKEMLASFSVFPKASLSYSPLAIH